MKNRRRTVTVTSDDRRGALFRTLRSNEDINEDGNVNLKVALSNLTQIRAVFGDMKLDQGVLNRHLRRRERSGVAEFLVKLDEMETKVTGRKTPLPIDLLDKEYQNRINAFDKSKPDETPSATSTN